jgi:hypothetical protein
LVTSTRNPLKNLATKSSNSFLYHSPVLDGFGLASRVEWAPIVAQQYFRCEQGMYVTDNAGIATSVKPSFIRNSRRFLVGTTAWLWLTFTAAMPVATLPASIGMTKAHADVALLMAILTDQTSVPWPKEFPRKIHRQISRQRQLRKPS